MKIYIPLNSNTIGVAAAMAGIDQETLIKKQQEAAFEYQRKADKQWALEKLGYDEAWWDSTMEKISQIKASLPSTISHADRTIAMYGWIKTKTGGTFSLPFRESENGHASAIEAILHNPNLYLKMSNFD